jgi:hypothetical protein
MDDVLADMPIVYGISAKNGNAVVDAQAVHKLYV